MRLDAAIGDMRCLNCGATKTCTVCQDNRTCPNCGDGEQNGFEAPNEPLCRVCSFLTSLREADRHMRRAWATFPDNGSTFLTHGERQTFHQLAKEISLFLEEVDA